jgi:catechol-2,3-dioxygenase
MSAGSRLGHVAIEVTNLSRSIEFYGAVLGLRPVARDERHHIVMLRAPGSDRFHDLALHEVRGTVHAAGGASHVAWEVDDIDALAAARDTLLSLHAVRWAADFGVSRSVFGVDPDGNAIEVAYIAPCAEWKRWEEEGTIFQPLLPETLAPRGSS